MRSWELFQVKDGIPKAGITDRVLNTGSYNNFFSYWLANRFQDTTDC